MFWQREEEEKSARKLTLHFFVNIGRKYGIYNCCYWLAHLFFRVLRCREIFVCAASPCLGRYTRLCLYSKQPILGLTQESFISESMTCYALSPGRKFFIPSMIAGTLAVIGWLNRQRSLAEMRRYRYGVTPNVLQPTQFVRATIFCLPFHWFVRAIINIVCDCYSEWLRSALYCIMTIYYVFVTNN